MRLSKPVNETITCKIAPSKIAGVGLFAIVPIKQYQKMYISEQLSQDFIDSIEFDTLNEKQKAFILERFPVYKETGFIHPHSDYLLSFVNHSKEENYSPVYDMALRDIAEGEEIVFDYKEYGFA